MKEWFRWLGDRNKYIYSSFHYHNVRRFTNISDFITSYRLKYLGSIEKKCRESEQMHLCFLMFTKWGKRRKKDSITRKVNFLSWKEFLCRKRVACHFVVILGWSDLFISNRSTEAVSTCWSWCTCRGWLSSSSLVSTKQILWEIVLVWKNFGFDFSK